MTQKEMIKTLEPIKNADDKTKWTSPRVLTALKTIYRTLVADPEVYEQVKIFQSICGTQSPPFANVWTSEAICVSVPHPDQIAGFSEALRFGIERGDIGDLSKMTTTALRGRSGVEEVGVVGIICSRNSYIIWVRVTYQDHVHPDIRLGFSSYIEFDRHHPTERQAQIRPRHCRW